MRRRYHAIAVLALLSLLALSGCTAAHVQHSSEPVQLPTPAATTPAAPTPSPTPTPTPSSTPKPKPTKTATTQPVRLSRVGGHGPAGSLRSTGSSAVALTFDDGPDPVNTPKLLDLLKKNGVKATFCVVGFRARDHPDLIRRIINEGHTICNHSWQHLLDLGQRPDDYVLHDLQATNNAIHAAAPKAKIKYFRAPGGNFTPGLVALAKRLGMTSIYWAVDTRDWEFTVYGHGTTMVDHIIASVEGSTRPGAIVLSHDNLKPDTITAYKTLLPWLKKRFKLIAMPT